MSDAEDPREGDDAANRRSALIALVFLIVLGFVGLWLASVLRRDGAVGDCLLAHGRNCDALVR